MMQDQINIDIAIQDPDWNNLETLKELAKQAVQECFRTAILPDIIKECAIEVSIVFANDDLIHVLNNEYRDKNTPTNVLSFAQIDSLDGQKPDCAHSPFALGDVILSYQTIEREAREQGKFLKDHTIHLIVHGTLHLMGYDHQEDHDATIMESLEIRILEKLGVQNPYTTT